MELRHEKLNRKIEKEIERKMREKKELERQEESLLALKQAHTSLL